MSPRANPILTLDQLVAGQEADLFLLLVARDELPTRDGKRYWRVVFRDATREVSFPIWHDSPLAEDCRDAWQPGTFYKVRGVYRETNYGPQLDIQRIREVTPSDADDGFDPAMCRARSRHDPLQMYQRLVEIAEQEIAASAPRELVVELLQTYRDTLLELPAAERNHHVYAGGWLEHTLATTLTAIYLADRYRDEYPDLSPPLDRDLVIAGALLHDIGKVQELAVNPTGAETTAAGHLIGHIVQGRDLVREAASGRELDPEWLLRLEHLMLSHQGSAEHGSPKLPMTAEALLVHFADDFDAKFHMLYVALRDDGGEGPVTSKKNVLMRSLYRGA